MEKPTLIPLFPLDVVLFPSMPLPLHIFEPRYKQMIARCIEQKIEFGMVLASENSVASTGCTAEILRVIREYPDGRMDILAEGRSPFRLKEMRSEEAYHQGIVEYLIDAPSVPDPRNESELIERFEQCHVLLFGQPWERRDTDEAFALSYRMAGRLPIEIANRQTLLETRSETERQAFLFQWLEELLPKLARRQQGRRIAGGNGHPVN